jgi:hypothetical protein
VLGQEDCNGDPTNQPAKAKYPSRVAGFSLDLLHFALKTMDVRLEANQKQKLFPFTQLYKLTQSQTPK